MNVLSAQLAETTSFGVEELIGSVRRRGWCVIENVVAPDDVLAIRELVLAEERRQSADREGWVRTSIGSADASRNLKLSKAQNIIPKIGARSTFLLEPRYRAVLTGLLGEYLRVSSDFGIVTFPGNEREFWHADWPYNQTVAAHICEPYGTTIMHLGSLIMLTDFTAENGGTMVLPGSHLSERNPTAGGNDAIASEHYQAEVQITGPAGSVFIYDTRLWHAIAENRTGTPRVALAVRFAPWWLNLDVRRPGSVQARLVESLCAGRPTPVPLLSRSDFEALPAGVRPLYEHWVEDDALTVQLDAAATPGLASDATLFDLRHGQYALPMTQLAIDLGLFQFLNSGRADLSAITAQLGCTTRAAEAMLAVQTALGHLRVNDDGVYRLSEVARSFLLPTSRFYRPTLLPESDPVLERLRPAFAADHDAVSPLAGEIGEMDQDALRDFVERMDALARPAAVAVAQNEGWSRIDRLLDVGGGAGAMCVAIAQKHPAISCTVLERGPVGRFAAEQIENAGLSGRITVIDGDMLTEKFPGGQDAVLFSNIFHNWDPAACGLLARKAFAALEPGGVVALHEVLLDPRKDGPLGAACFSVAMLLSHRGKQYTFAELREILTQAGFVDCCPEPALGRYHLVWATKPITS